MRRETRCTWQRGLHLAVASAMMLVVGCAEAPTRSAGGTESGVSYIVLGADAARAAKRIVNAGTRIEDVFGHKGGDLVIVQETDKARKVVEFTVKKAALPKGSEVSIAMEVWGDYASQLAVAFAPSGLVFEKECILKIEVTGEWLDLEKDQIQPLHITAAGEIETARIKKLKIDGDKLRIDIRVPGFSRYSLGDGGI